MRHVELARAWRGRNRGCRLPRNEAREYAPQPLREAMFFESETPRAAGPINSHWLR
jgi:hypothetical protein